MGGLKPGLKVFISLTFIDNERRRQLVEDAVINAGMLPVGMERFTASTRPTVEFVRKLIGECDVLVGLIANRYGWVPEDPQEPKRSITEIEYGAASAKPRLMFLIDPRAPVNVEEDFDELPGRWEKQQRLEEFRARIRKDQMPGVFSNESLALDVYRALTGWRDGQAMPTADDGAARESSSTVPSRLADELARYRQRLIELHSNFTPIGFERRVRFPIKLEELHVPLHAMADLRTTQHADELVRSAEEAEERLHGDLRSVNVPLTDAFGHAAQRNRRGLVILGDPGSGKTTHLKRLALALAKDGQASLGLPAEMVPVLLLLRNRADPKFPLVEWFATELERPELHSTPGFGRRLLARGNLLFLVDGLDEVANEAQRNAVAEQLAAAIAAFPSCTFVLTSRYAGYQLKKEPKKKSKGDKPSLASLLLELHLLPFNPAQAEAFIANWYEQVEKHSGVDPGHAGERAKERAGELIQRLREPKFRVGRVAALTRNPLLLTNICLVHRDRYNLPDRRIELYEECVRVLLQLWHEAVGVKVSIDAERSRLVLQPLAFWLHATKRARRATAAEIEKVIEKPLAAIGWKKGAAAFLRTIEHESGLLVGWGDGSFGFMHLAFQEYLCACELRTRSYGNPKVLADLAGAFGDSWWQEVTLLVVAFTNPSISEHYLRELVKLPAFAAKPELVDELMADANTVGFSPEPFVEVVTGKAPRTSADWQRHLAAARVLGATAPDRLCEIEFEPWEALLRRDSRGDPELETLQLAAAQVLEKAAPARLARLQKKAASQPQRATFLERMQSIFVAPRHLDLSRSRQGGVELVAIPGGTFLMGSLAKGAPNEDKGAYDDECPQHSVTVRGFLLGRFAVTNEEYARFLAAKPGTPEPSRWTDGKFNQHRQPVVGVTWDEAVAFCKWAGGRLPSEAEWEYACRAGTTTRFWSGDADEDLARVGWFLGYADGRTHPVGEKPANPWGLHDLHGNVWEWCSDWAAPYPNAAQENPTGPEAGTLRVLRGGCYYNGARLCRSACRSGLGPSRRLGGLGFRVASPAPRA